MKKILFGLLFILLIGFAFPKTTVAAVSCGETCKISTDCVAECPVCINPRGIGMICSKSSVTPGSTDPLAGCPGGKSINSAIGCIPVLDTKEAFLSFVLRWAVGIGGGIAFLLIIYAGFMIMTSAGNPERLKAGQELLTSAISGLILLIFSVVILKIIGVDILGLDNFGFGK